LLRWLIGNDGTDKIVVDGLDRSIDSCDGKGLHSGDGITVEDALLLDNRVRVGYRLEDTHARRGAPPPGGSLSRIVPHGVRAFDPLIHDCDFCHRRGHDISFCPSIPRHTHGNHFLTGLLTSPAVPRARFAGMTLEEAMRDIDRTGALLNDGNPWHKSPGRAFDLRRALGYWKAIGSGTSSSWIGHGAPLPFHHAPERLAFENSRACEEHMAFIDAEMNTHLRDGTFIMVDPGFVEVVNPLTVVVNEKGKARLCLDLRYPNAFVPPVKFHLETLEADGHNIVRRGDVLLFADLEKAYYSVAMASDARPYLCWQWRGRFICSVVVPFGATLAPFHFHKIMREAVRFMRMLALRVHNYLDDFMLACDAEDAADITRFMQWFLARLGWRISIKSVWKPSPRGDFLGLIVDAESYRYRVPSAKLDKALTMARALHERWVPGCQPPAGFANLAGLLASFKIAFVGVRPFTRALYRAAGTERSGAPLSADDCARLRYELHWWLHALSDPARNGLPIREPGVEVVVNFDASQIGYGAVCGTSAMRISGLFPATVIDTSSTYRELLGVVLACEQLTEQLRNRVLLARLDSLPAVCNLINGGGGVPALADLVKHFTLWCLAHGVTPQFEWVPREENKDADVMSKLMVGRWALRAAALDNLQLRFGPFVAPFEDGIVLCTPEGGKVRDCLLWAQQCRLDIALVHPLPISAAWGAVVARYATRVSSVSLGNACELFEPPHAGYSFPNWPMAVSLLHFGVPS
jgi:hypothetical protein